MDKNVLERILTSKGKLHKYVKLPLMIGTLAAGMCSAIATLASKLFGELIKDGIIKDNINLSIGCLIATAFSILGLVFQMNSTMMFYQQMEVMPIYQANILLAWTITGTMILREMHDAEWYKKLYMAAGITLILIGTKILTSKKEYNLKIEMEKKRVAWKSSTQGTAIEMVSNP